MDIAVGSVVVTTRYPGVWEVVEMDGGLARIKSDAKGTITVSVSSLTATNSPKEEPLSKEILAERVYEVCAPIMNFCREETVDKMVSLGFTDRRVYRDILAELVAVVAKGRPDAVSILQEAVEIIATEQNNVALKAAATGIKNR